MSKIESNDPNVVGMIVKGAAGQAVDLFQFQDSDGNTLWNVDKDGAVSTFRIPASYLIYKTGSTYYARNGQTSAIDYSGTDAATVMNDAAATLRTAGGGRIFVRAGQYDITSILDLCSRVYWVGEGPGNAGNGGVIYGGTYLNNQMTDGSPTFKTITGDGSDWFCGVSDMGFVSIANTDSGAAIETQDHTGSPYTLTDQIIVKNLHIRGMGGHGINFPSRVEFSTFEDLVIDHCGGDGIHADYLLVVCDFRRLNLYINGGDGIHIANHIGTRVHIEQSSGNVAAGVHVVDGQNGIFEIMYTESNGTEGMTIGGTSYDIFRGNVTDGYTIAGYHTLRTGYYQTISNIQVSDYVLTKDLQVATIKPTEIVGNNGVVITRWDGAAHHAVAVTGQGPGGNLYGRWSFLEMMKYCDPVTLAVNDANPEVQDGNVFLTANTNPTSVLTFGNNNQLGQIIYIRAGDAVTTLVHSANLKLKGGVNKTLTLRETITLIKFEYGVWDEV